MCEGVNCRARPYQAGAWSALEKHIYSSLGFDLRQEERRAVQRFARYVHMRPARCATYDQNAHKQIILILNGNIVLYGDTAAAQSRALAAAEAPCSGPRLSLSALQLRVCILEYRGCAGWPTAFCCHRSAKTLFQRN